MRQVTRTKRSIGNIISPLLSMSQYSSYLLVHYSCLNKVVSFESIFEQSIRIFTFLIFLSTWKNLVSFSQSIKSMKFLHNLSGLKVWFFVTLFVNELYENDFRSRNSREYQNVVLATCKGLATWGSLLNWSRCLIMILLSCSFLRWALRAFLLLHTVSQSGQANSKWPSKWAMTTWALAFFCSKTEYTQYH